jgi:hypothetical protein
LNPRFIAVFNATRKWALREINPFHTNPISQKMNFSTIIPSTSKSFERFSPSFPAKIVGTAAFLADVILDFIYMII